jgi:protein tyrosine/serine phosphatase
MILKYNGLGIYKFLCICAQPSNHPILMHCSHGKDRTGLAAALVLAALGVNEEAIMLDYVASTVLGGTEEAWDDILVRVHFPIIVI